MVAELRGRMEEDARWYGGTLPREAAVAWEGYLAGLIEWGVLSVAEHERLCRLLPPVDDSPATRILTGWEADGEDGSRGAAYRDALARPKGFARVKW